MTSIETSILEHVSILSLTGCDDPYLYLARTLIDHAVSVYSTRTATTNNSMMNVFEKLDILESVYVSKPIATIRFCIRFLGVDALLQRNSDFVLKSVELCLSRVVKILFRGNMNTKKPTPWSKSIINSSVFTQKYKI